MLRRGCQGKDQWLFKVNLHYLPWPQGIHKDCPCSTPASLDCLPSTPASLVPHAQFLLNWDLTMFQHLLVKVGLQRDGETLRTPGTKAKLAGREGVAKRTFNARAGSLATGFLSNREGAWDRFRAEAKGRIGSKERLQAMLQSISPVLTRNYALTSCSLLRCFQNVPRGADRAELLSLVVSPLPANML